MSIQRSGLLLILAVFYLGCGEMVDQTTHLETEEQGISYGQTVGQSDAAKPVVKLVFHDGGICTGTIIADQWIVTSAHCIPNCSPDFPCTNQFNKRLEVYVNLLTYVNRPWGWSLEPQKVYDAYALMYPNPSYTYKGDSNDDIALIRLNGPMDWPANQSDYRMRLMNEWTWVGAEFDTYGWGITEDGTLPIQLQTNPSPRRVAATYSRSFKSYVNPSGNCSGDSGGPAVRDAPNEPPVLFGVLSSGQNNVGTFNGCPNQTGYNKFTQIKPHLAWILNTLALYGQQCRIGTLTRYWDLDYYKCY